MIQTHAKFAPLDFINKKKMKDERETQIFLPIPNIPFKIDHSWPLSIITHLAGQTYVWHGCKWNFAGPQIYLQPAKIKYQHFGVSLKFLVCN